MIVNAPNSPGVSPWPLSAVQSISETASVMSPSSVLIGVVSFTVFWTWVQPATGSTSTDAIGVSVGNCTFSPTVSAFFSTGTRNVISWSPPPCTAPGALTVTCADAAPARASEAAAIVTEATANLRMRLMVFRSVEVDLDVGGGRVELARADDEREHPRARRRQDDVVGGVGVLAV